MKDIAAFIKVLADEARLRILWLLSNREELCVCDIMEVLGITQSKASRHLATLRHAGLVIDRKEAVWSHYSLTLPEGELKRALLEVLTSHLRGRPESVRLCRDLDRWLKRKSREGMCAMKAAPSPKVRTATARRSRPSHPGGNR